MEHLLKHVTFPVMCVAEAGVRGSLPLIAVHIILHIHAYPYQVQTWV